jgi:hypothetical protein
MALRLLVNVGLLCQNLIKRAEVLDARSLDDNFGPTTH